MNKRKLPWQIKICGVSSMPEVVAVAAAGADAVGLNFYQRSMRNVSVTDAAIFVRTMQDVHGPAAGPVPVGLFVNHSADQIIQTVAATGIEWIQLHGDERPEILRSLPPLSVIRAIRVDAQLGLEVAVNEAARWIDAGVAAILLDAPLPKPQGHEDAVPDDSEEPVPALVYGGTGRTVDWTMARQIVSQLPVPVVLAGGLNPQNVAAAIEAVRPAAVDVASGVEGLPARKNFGLVRDFVGQARQAFGAG